MKIDRNSAEIISLEKAVKYTHAFQKKNPDTIKSFFVGSEKLKLILEQENCIGIRIYNGYNEEEERENLVLVGVDASGEDMTRDVILEELTPCPKVCPIDSELIVIPEETELPEEPEEPIQEELEGPEEIKEEE
jgi:hypothetical protein